MMRTTIVMDDDVMERARLVAVRGRTPFRAVVNEALRAGLNQLARAEERKRYRTLPHAMKVKDGRNLDNIQELLAQVEGEGAR